MKPFEPSSCAAAFDGPNTLMPARVKIVGKASDERHLGSNGDKADVVLGAEADNGRVVGDVEQRDALCHGRQYPRCRGHNRACPNWGCATGRGQGMLAAAGADEEYVHGNAAPVSPEIACELAAFRAAASSGLMYHLPAV